MNRNSNINEYIEGVHRFHIDAGYHVCRIECSEFYACHAQNFCGGCKEMDFLLYHPVQQDLWLIEVKDYRFDARPKVTELIHALSRKVRDTLFLLKAAALSAPQESPAEGMALLDFARLATQAKTLHLAFLLELGMHGMWHDGGLLANIKNLLYSSMRFLDADLICAPITAPYKNGPWTVSPAHGDVSKRIEQRRAKKMENLQIRTLDPVFASPPSNHIQTEILPQWKRRLQQRTDGGIGNHADKRKRRRHGH